MSNVTLIADSPSPEILGDLRKPGPWVCLSKVPGCSERNRTPPPLREPVGTRVTSRGKCGKQEYWSERTTVIIKLMIMTSCLILSYLLFGHACIKILNVTYRTVLNHHNLIGFITLVF